MSSAVIGIDIAKHKFDSSFTLNNHTWHHGVFDNTPNGFQDFLEWINKHGISRFHIAMKATGCYGEGLAEFIYEKGYKVSILNQYKFDITAKVV